MSAQTLLSGGDKWFSYSGVTSGGVSVPATIQLNFIPNTGLRDSVVQFNPYFGRPITAAVGDGLGLIIKIDDVIIYKGTTNYGNNFREDVVSNSITLFIPRQSKLEVLSMNTSNNNNQERGCNLTGYYL
jgi:hypothetical protein